MSDEGYCLRLRGLLFAVSGADVTRMSRAEREFRENPSGEKKDADFSPTLSSGITQHSGRANRHAAQP